MVFNVCFRDRRLGAFTGDFKGLAVPVEGMSPLELETCRVGPVLTY